MATMECPICSEKFEEEFVEYLDNGNPACPRCVDEEDNLKNRDKD